MWLPLVDCIPPARRCAKPRSSMRANRQIDLETGSGGSPARGMNAATGSFHDGARNGETQPAMPGLPFVPKGGVAGMGGKAGVEDSVQRLARNSRSAILDGERQAPGAFGDGQALPQCKPDAAPLGHRLGGILDQVHQNPSQNPRRSAAPAAPRLRPPR